MENKLFGRTKAEKDLREVIKARSLLACEKERVKLTTCFRDSWFGWCAEEHKQFWDCFVKVCHNAWSFKEMFIYNVIIK